MTKKKQYKSFLSLIALISDWRVYSQLAQIGKFLFISRAFAEFKKNPSPSILTFHE